jgi:hypothetical protein
MGGWNTIAASRKKFADFRKSALDAGLDVNPSHQFAQIRCNFRTNTVSCVQRNMSFTHDLSELLSAECDKNTDHDDPDFLEEITPTVKRLRQVNVHGSASRALRYQKCSCRQ